MTLYKLDNFVLSNLFHEKKLHSGDTIYYRECKDEGEGYIILYPDGNHHHTYQNPENLE